VIVLSVSYIKHFQDTYNNMPFQSWEIRPQGPDCVIFTLIAATVELEIAIKENACCLNSPEDIELDGIRNKWLPSHILMQVLTHSVYNQKKGTPTNPY